MIAAESEASPCRIISLPDTPERRLRRALRQLDRAMDQQRDAVAAFRLQLDTLGDAVARLDARTLTLRSALAGAAAEAACAQRVAQELAAAGLVLEAVARR